MTVTTLVPSGSGPIVTGTFAVQPTLEPHGNGICADRTAILPDGINVRGWVVDGADAPRLAAWLRCRDLWLNACYRRSGSQRTAHEYRRVWTSFYETTHGCKLLPWVVDGTAAQEWAAQLSRRLAPASVNKSLSVLSSYYRFCARQFTDGARLYLGENPFTGENLRARVSRFGRSAFPTTDQVLALCAVIDTTTPRGLRDYVLIRGMFETTRRLNEWLPLQWRDIAGNTFRCRLKGGKENWQELPAELYAEIQAYLAFAHRWPPQPDDHLFPPILSRPMWDRPLHPGNVNRIIRKYGRLAGVPDPVCHAHGLRHAGARARRELGATNREMQTILGHANIGTTEIYCRELLDQPHDRLGAAVDALFAGFGRRARILYSRDTSTTL